MVQGEHMTQLIVGILVWTGLIIAAFGALVAFGDNFIIGALIIGFGGFIALCGIVINNNEIIAEEWKKHDW